MKQDRTKMRTLKWHLNHLKDCMLQQDKMPLWTVHLNSLTEQVLTVCWSSCGSLCNRRLHPLNPRLCQGRQGSTRCRRWVVVVLHCTAWHQTVRLSEDRHLWPPGGPLYWAEGRRRGLCSSLWGLGDPWDRGWGQLGIHPPGRGGGLTGPCHAELCSSVCGAGDGVGRAFEGRTPTAQADLRPFEAKAGYASTGGVVNLFRGDLNGDFCAAGRGRVRVAASC